MAYFPPTGSVVAYQSVPSSLLTGASIVGQLPAGTAPLGSVATLQGTNPWIVSGSVTLLNGANIMGSVTALQGTNPYLVSFGNSSIFATQQGTHIASVVSSTPSSMLTGASIFGMLPAGTQLLGSVATLQGTNPWIETFSNSSILAVPVGSYITYLQSSSILAVPVGSTITYLQTSSILAVPVGSTIVYLQAPSIVGTYAEDAGHTSADKGVFMLTVRNDTAASVASADLDYTLHAVDAVGRTLTKPFVGEDATIISYTGSVVSASVTLLQASAIGKKSYITDFLISNTGTATQLITFLDGSTSVLGYTIAPAGGGSNAIGWNISMKTANAQDLAFKTTGTSSVVYVTVKGYQAQ